MATSRNDIKASTFSISSNKLLDPILSATSQNRF